MQPNQHSQAKYVVLDEHTLCYRIDGQTPGWKNFVGVLQGSVLRGGHDWRNGSVCISPRSNVREATQADFDFFRVSSTGHLPEKTERTSHELNA